MSSQETFATFEDGGAVIQVIKTYDERYAREAFDQMDDEALKFLEKSLEPLSNNDGDDHSFSDYLEGLWEGIQEGAREDWNAFSYFIAVKTSAAGIRENLFVSADWPTAEQFVRERLSPAKSGLAS